MKVRDLAGGLLFPAAWWRPQYSDTEEGWHEALQRAGEEADEIPCSANLEPVDG